MFYKVVHEQCFVYKNMFSSFIIIPYTLQFYNISRCSCMKTESKPKFDRKTNQNKCVIINTASGYKLLDINYWAWIPSWIDYPSLLKILIFGKGLAVFCPQTMAGQLPGHDTRWVKDFLIINVSIIATELNILPARIYNNFIYMYNGSHW